MERAVIHKMKRAGYSIEVGAYIVAEDEFGTWLFTPASSVARYRQGDDVVLRPWPNFLSLAQSEEWFWAGWWDRDGDRTISTDACTTPEHSHGVWSWTDLELDVLRNAAGEVWLEDEDEFEDAINAGAIRSHEQAGALAVSDELLRRLRDHVAPFDLETGWRYHDDAVARGLAPLPEV